MKMGDTAKSLGIDKLSLANRLALIGELWDSVISETEAFPLPDGVKTELDRRIEQADCRSKSTISWGQIKKETLARLRK